MLPKSHFFVLRFAESECAGLPTLLANGKLNISSEIRLAEYFVSYITICFHALQALKSGQNKTMQTSILSQRQRAAKEEHKDRKVCRNASSSSASLGLCDY